MKVSLCCGRAPYEHPSGIGSIELGLCPKCGEHTEFCDLTYKVLHDYGGDFYTSNVKEARDRFNQYIDDGCDGVRLYEGLATSDDTDEIDWDIIDCYNRCEEEILGYYY